MGTHEKTDLNSVLLGATSKKATITDDTDDTNNNNDSNIVLDTTIEYDVRQASSALNIDESFLQFNTASEVTIDSNGLFISLLVPSSSPPPSGVNTTSSLPLSSDGRGIFILPRADIQVIIIVYYMYAYVYMCALYPCILYTFPIYTLYIICIYICLYTGPLCSACVYRAYYPSDPALPG